MQRICTHQIVNGLNMGESLMEDGNIDVFVSGTCAECSEYLGIVHFVSTLTGELVQTDDSN